MQTRDGQRRTLSRLRDAQTSVCEPASFHTHGTLLLEDKLAPPLQSPSEPCLYALLNLGGASCGVLSFDP